MSPGRGAIDERGVPVFEHVVVGVDRREGGRDAVALAARLASEGARLTLGHVYHGDDSAWRGAVPPYEPAERRQAEQELRTAAREAAVVAKVRCHGAASVGRGLHELAELAAADLLVVGSSRRGVVGRRSTTARSRCWRARGIGYRGWTALRLRRFPARRPRH